MKTPRSGNAWLGGWLVLTLVTGCDNTPVTADPPPDLTAWVDPLIGSLGPGNVVPGPCVPHGMVKLSPDTNARQGSIDAYEWANDRIEGFSHTHLEGPGGGGNGYSQISVLPVVGDVPANLKQAASLFSHDQEIAQVGYYAVTLLDYGVRAELTATRRTGVHRYTFPQSDQSHLVFDLEQNRGMSLGGFVEAVGEDGLQGWGRYQVNPLIGLTLSETNPGTGEAQVYFAARFSRPFDSVTTRPQGDSVAAVVAFSTRRDEEIEVRVGISYIDMEQAWANLEAEAMGRSFDEVAEAARSEWNGLLARVRVTGTDEAELTRFYTALYHSLMVPADYTEDGRFFCGADGQGRVIADAGHRYFTDNWAIWDTVRSTHPLAILVHPEVVPDMMQSLVLSYQEGGWMQKSPWNALGDARVMTGNFQFCVVAEAYRKGIRGFDAQTAFEAMRKGSMEEGDHPLSEGLCGYFNQGTPPDYVRLGWVPDECDIDQSASMTLEHAYNDGCVAAMAQALGHEDDAAFFRQRAQNYRNVFNPEHGMMQRKRRNGTWVEPFDPTEMRGFTEADSWKYTWTVQQDLCGLVELMGGNAAFEAKLDDLFAGGHFDMGNEPDFHVPFLYDWVGAAHKTQARVRQLMRDEFSDGPGGLPGNDDAGATSAWYVFSALGLYPVSPGVDEWYAIASPVFEEAVLYLGGPQRVRFTIRAPGASPDHPYVQSARLNGRALASPRIHHDELMAGGTLELTMGAQPSDWGTSICP